MQKRSVAIISGANEWPGGFFNIIALAGRSQHKRFLISGADYGKWVIKACDLTNGSHGYLAQGLPLTRQPEWL